MERESSVGSNGLGKLLPKSISDRRFRRKQRKAQLERSESPRPDERRLSSAPDSDIDNDSIDDRSLGSFESGLDQEQTSLTKPESITSESPTRPAGPSTHPSLIGLLTTSSPVVQAKHIDPESQPTIRIDSSNISRGRSLPDDLDPSEAPTVVTSVTSPGRRSRLALDTEPKTPPGSGQAAPAISHTPPTPTEQLSSARASLDKLSSPTRSVASTGSPSRTMGTHQRSVSASAALGPSKLSSFTSAPLTPTVEEGDTTPSASANSGSGFFSSMFSAAQSAATNFSSNIQTSGINLGNNKSKTTIAPTKSVAVKQEPQVIVEPAQDATANKPMGEKESAIQTLGAGDLSLSHLGLADSPDSAASTATARLADMADTRSRSESAPVDTPTKADFLHDGSSSRPRSPVEAPSRDSSPPPSQPDNEEKSGTRPSSLKSFAHVHRKRNSSVTTSNTGYAVGAALGASNTTGAQSAGQGPDRKLTGFAIASKKRNHDFHSVFKSVPDDDYLIEDYSCALQREILAHGRLYVSEGHLCFSSNILGWSTTLVMSFDEIVSVEKRSTALVFKNGLMITTLHAKHVFASFTSRDATYDLIINIWKLGHPTLKSTLNGVQLEGTGGDKTEKIDSEQVDNETETHVASDSDIGSEDDEEEFYDEEENDEDAGAHPSDPTTATTEDKAIARKASGMTMANGVIPAASKDIPPASGNAAADIPGPAVHAPTDCGDTATHYDKIVGDDTISAPLGKIYSLLFGAESPAFMSKWLTGDQKCTELQMDDKKGINLETKTRTYNFIKPLYAPIGPRQTKCIITESVENLDFEKAANLTVSTQTPDVPSGNVFAVKTKYCLSWAENNSTRVQVNCTIEWSGKSWLKGPIEKGASDGQTQHCKDLFAALRVAVSSRSRAGTATNGTVKVRRKGKKSKTSQSAIESEAKGGSSKAVVKQDWGMLEPLRPFVDIFQPLLSGNIMYGILVGLLVASWFGFGFTPRKNVAPYGIQGGIYSADRLAAYEEMWHREDSAMWEWLEERVGLGQLTAEALNARKKVAEPRSVEQRLRQEKMDQREIDEAIRVTEEKLRILKEATVKGPA